MTRGGIIKNPVMNIERKDKDEEKEEYDNSDAWMSSLLQVQKELDKLVKNDHGLPYVHGSASKTLPSIPGLCIEGVGPISLPITYKIADAIKEAGQSAPTIIDRSIPNILQVGASHLEFSNPAWHSGLKKTVGW